MFEFAYDQFGHFYMRMFHGPIWWKQFVEWVNAVDVIRTKLLLLLGQEDVTNLNK